MDIIALMQGQWHVVDGISSQLDDKRQLVVSISAYLTSSIAVTVNCFLRFQSGGKLLAEKSSIDYVERVVFLRYQEVHVTG